MRWSRVFPANSFFVFLSSVAFSLSLFSSSQAFAQSANCQPPNLLIILDRSGSMAFTGTSFIPSQACTNRSQCAPMPRTHQPTPGTTPLYDYQCNPVAGVNRCHYTRWDVAQNAIKEVAFQYGGTAPGYTNAQIRFGLETFSSTASILAPIVSNPPAVSTAIAGQTATGGTNYIPAFDTGRAHLKTVVDADTLKRRPTHILFITDGDSSDSCATTQGIARDLFQGTGTYALTDNQGNVYKVKTYVIGFGSGLSTTGQTCLNQIAANGGTQRCDPTIAGCVAYYTADNGTELQAAMNSIINNATQEVCDGIDNDCNGQTDENNPGGGGSCSTGQPGVCSAGRLTCQAGRLNCVPNAQSSAEICDGLDNNCNGSVDENNPGGGGTCNSGQQGACATGTLTCQSGRLNCVAPAPKAETCDGLDNNCDGQVDNNPSGVGATCNTGQIGACSVGRTVCQNGSLVCFANVQPTAEVCDGIDNNCNGSVDENNPGGGVACNTGLQGACASGSMTCQAGRLTCVGPSPSTEICDGLDNNCNGQIDENNPGGGGSCSTGLQGPCVTGRLTCQTGRLNCVPLQQPSPEICDGIDNDCNGQIDDGNPGGGASCSTGQQGVCGTGTMTCQAGRLTCVAPTASAEICDGKDNNCDGQIDEGDPGGGGVCTSGQPGLCAAGIRHCQNGQLNCVPNLKPTAEKCDGFDNDCNGQIDETFPRDGQPCEVGVGECKRTGTYVCVNKVESCSATAGTPATELCDGKDNNCNGQIDEDYPNLGQACSNGDGECKRSGKFACRPDGLASVCDAVATAPQPEACDNKDNDCNGQIDDNLNRSCSTICGTGIEVCQAGKWTGCTAQVPSAEVCDGKDNDCDGTVDNGLTRPCSTACAQGTETCVNGAWAFCDAKKPDPEICDGKDNDCNGQIDENIQPQTCQGDCGQGTATCVNGAFTGCSGPKPEPEVCNGKDDDCNGKIDDGLSRTCKTDCGEGTEFCQNGQWTPCDAKKPDPEICDGKDNDCDGKIDDEAPCPTAGQTCVEGMCRAPCNNGECPRGSQCRNGICYSITCDGITCPADQVCKSGSCVDACLGVTCPTGQVCKNGSCVEDNCYGLGCPTGQVCQLGKCVADPCFGLTCPSGEFCRGGSCVGICTSNLCPGQKCVDGKCEADPCSGVSCPAEQRCVDGKCIADPCFGIKCPQGRLCVDGQCEDDPCLTIQCPKGSVCKNGQCSQNPNQGENNQGENNQGENNQGENNQGENPNPGDGSNPDGSNPDDPNPDGSQSDADQGDTTHNDKNSGNPNNQPDKPGGGQTPGGCGCQQTSSPWMNLLFALFLLLIPAFLSLSLRRQTRS